MSHHYSGPNFGFPHGDPRLDLTDVYAFPKPGDTGKSILIMDVHPQVTLAAFEATTTEPFTAEGLYELKIDTDGDYVADIAYRVQFSPFAGGAQSATVRCARGAEAAGVDGGEVIIAGAPVSLGREARVTAAGDYRFFAGWRSDPFFFDVLGAGNDLKFTGHDFFVDKDVCSIVLEAPNAVLGSKEVRIWARTMDGRSGALVQAERGALPTQAVFLPGDSRDAYLAAEPANDAQFVAAFAHSLEHSGGYAPDDARRAAAGLLPDVMRFDPSRPARYPVSGRALTDDVINHFLAILTNGKAKDDGVGPHTDLLAEFPYVGPPHRDASAPLG